MALPNDVTVFDLHFGDDIEGYTDATGAVTLLGAKGKLHPIDLATGKRINLVHVATGQAILPTDITVVLDEGGKAKATVEGLPHTDNAGLSTVGFGYEMEWDLPSGPRHATPGNKRFAVPTAAGATADFDLLDVAEAVPGVVVPIGVGPQGPVGPQGVPGVADDASVAAAVVAPLTGAALRAAFDAWLQGKGNARPAALAKLDARLGARMTQPARLVFTGSSTTQGSNATTGDFRYVDILVGMLQGLYPNGGTESRVWSSTTATFTPLTLASGVHGYNVGQGGATSWDWLTPAEQANVAALDPAAVFHMIGANDYSGGQVTPADYKANVLAAVNAIKAAAAGPLVQVLIHTFRPLSTAGAHSWDAFGSALREIADADPNNVVFIDLSDAYELLDHDGADPLNLIDTDNVHQTNAGHRFMATLLGLALGYPSAPRRPGRILLSDPFDRADGALGVADTGQAWATLVGGWAIAGGKLSVTTGGTVHVDAGSSDVDITCTITTGAATPGVVFCSQDENNRLGIFFAAANTVVDLIRKDGGVNTTIATGSNPAPTASGRNFRVRILKIGDRITCWVNDVIVLTHQLSPADHAKYKAFTFVGFRSAAADSVIRWDDLLVRMPVA